jgi:hypothetical protein
MLVRPDDHIAAILPMGDDVIAAYRKAAHITT